MIYALLIAGPLLALIILMKGVHSIMASLEQLLAAAEAEDNKIDSLIALTGSIKEQLDAAIGGALTPDQQARVDAIFAAISDNPDRIQAAIDANTPASPSPTPDPETPSEG